MRGPWLFPSQFAFEHNGEPGKVFVLGMASKKRKLAHEYWFATPWQGHPNLWPLCTATSCPLLRVEAGGLVQSTAKILHFQHALALFANVSEGVAAMLAGAVMQAHHHHVMGVLAFWSIRLTMRLRTRLPRGLLRTSKQCDVGRIWPMKAAHLRRHPLAKTWTCPASKKHWVFSAQTA